MTTNVYCHDNVISAGLTIVANVAIATGPALLGAPRSSVINLIYYIIYNNNNNNNSCIYKAPKSDMSL